MHLSARSPVSVGVAVAMAGAITVVPPPPAPVPVQISSDYRLAADPVPIGGLVTSFVGNQLIYCSIICPDIVKLAATVPIGAALAPATFVTTLAAGSPLKALGAAVASVTVPLNAAFDPIISNDLNLVLPRAQNALEVGVVGLLNVATPGPEGLIGAIRTARQDAFDALNDTIPPSQTSPNPRGLVQVVAVEAINVVSSIAFQAFEEGLLGVVQTVNAAATTLARTGDPVAAFVAGEGAAVASFNKSVGYVVDASRTAVTNIAAALRDPIAARPGSSAPVATVAEATQQRATVVAKPGAVERPIGKAPRDKDVPAVRAVDTVAHKVKGRHPGEQKAGSNKPAHDTQSKPNRHGDGSRQVDKKRDDRRDRAESTHTHSS